jgi:hypothetical protein
MATLWKSAYYKQKLLTNNLLGTAYTFPTTLYIGLYVCNFNSTAANPGYWAESVAATAGQYVSPTTANGHLYVCTTAGTTGTTQPTWPTGIGSTVVDGTVTWTEATEYLIGFNTTYPPVEVSGGGYARASIAQGTTDWAALVNSPDGLGSQSSNAVLINGFASPTANWGLVAGLALLDASTAGDVIYGVSLLTTYLTIISGNPAPTIPIGDLVVEEI